MSTIQRWALAIGLFVGVSGPTLFFSLGGTHHRRDGDRRLRQFA
jgi:hypothetical protein